MTWSGNWSNFTFECSGYVGDYYSTFPNIDQFYELYLFNTIVNAVSALTAVCGNVVVLTGILITPSLRRTPSYWLISSQVCTDLALGLAQPLISFFMAAEITGKDILTVCTLGQVILFICFFLLSATGLGLTALSIDRLLAIRLKTMYKVTVTKKRVAITIAGLWVFSLALAIIAFYVDNHRYVTIMFLCFASSCSTITTICYASAIKALKIHMKDINPSRGTSQTNSATLDVNKYKKTLWTMIIIEIVLMFFAIPICASWMYMFIHGLTVYSMTILFTATTFFNLVSSINPLIYICRMNDIRNASRAVLRKVCCFLHSSNPS